MRDGTGARSLERRQRARMEDKGFRVIASCGEASPKIWSCYANFSVFIDYIRNQFLKK